MKISLLSGIYAVSIAASLILSGCTSTEIIEPANKVTPDETIILNLSASESFGYLSTKATGHEHDGHKIRFVAKLYSENNGTEKLIDRKEVLAIDVNKSIIFTAEPGNYTVTLFADYIDEGATPDSHGKYPDKYYDTTGAVIKVKPIISANGTDQPATDYIINNDNYDCFAMRATITKEASTFRANLFLPRITSKVRIIDKGGNGSDTNGVESISIKKFSCMDEYNFQANAGGAHKELSTNQINGLPSSFAPSNLQERELFYFYTFGNNPDGKAAYIQPDEISFSINGKEAYEYKDGTIPGGLLDLRPNYIYKVTGNFLSPTSAPTNEIILTVSTDENWKGDGTDQEVD